MKYFFIRNQYYLGSTVNIFLTKKTKIEYDLTN